MATTLWRCLCAPLYVIPNPPSPKTRPKVNLPFCRWVPAGKLRTGATGTAPQTAHGSAPSERGLLQMEQMAELKGLVPRGKGSKVSRCNLSQRKPGQVDGTGLERRLAAQLPV